MQYLFAIVLGYLSGSVPYGLLLTRAAGLGDVRAIGSGNIGATNVLRTGNKFIAAMTLVCDMLKGTLPVLLAGYLWNRDAAVVAAFAAMAGHIFPVWLNFKGGKGVATFAGVLFGLHWPLALVFLAIWLALACAFKFSSLAALLSSAVCPVGAVLMNRGDLALPILALAAVIWMTHRGNIARLLKGAESKINLNGKT